MATVKGPKGRPKKKAKAKAGPPTPACAECLNTLDTGQCYGLMEAKLKVEQAEDGKSLAESQRKWPRAKGPRAHYCAPCAKQKHPWARSAATQSAPFAAQEQILLRSVLPVAASYGCLIDTRLHQADLRGMSGGAAALGDLGSAGCSMPRLNRSAVQLHWKGVRLKQAAVSQRSLGRGGARTARRTTKGLPTAAPTARTAAKGARPAEHAALLGPLPQSIRSTERGSSATGRRATGYRQLASAGSCCDGALSAHRNTWRTGERLASRHPCCSALRAD